MQESEDCWFREDGPKPPIILTNSLQKTHGRLINIKYSLISVWLPAKNAETHCDCYDPILKNCTGHVDTIMGSVGSPVIA